MCTTENRGHYDRGMLRYPSDLTDEEWPLVEHVTLSHPPGAGLGTLERQLPGSLARPEVFMEPVGPSRVSLL